MNDATTVGGLCASADRCRAFDRTRDPPGPAYVTPRCPLCPDCLTAAERDVRALVLDYAGLEQLLPRSLGEWSDGQPVSLERGEQPLVPREWVLVLQADIVWITTTWAEILADEDRLSDPPDGGVRDGWSVQHAVAVIAPRVQLLAQQGPVEVWDYPAQRRCEDHAVFRCADCHQPRESLVTGVQAVQDLQLLHAMARSMLGIDGLVRQLPGDCPNDKCDGRDTLRVANGKDTVWCTRCEMRRPYDEYERYLKMIVWESR